MSDQTIIDPKMKKEIKAREGVMALAEYYAKSAATDEKTARLREARLAREAAERAAPKPAEKPRTVKRKARE